jgi:hypothetical protein
MARGVMRSQPHNLDSRSRPIEVFSQSHNLDSRSYHSTSHHSAGSLGKLPTDPTQIFIQISDIRHKCLPACCASAHIEPPTMVYGAIGSYHPRQWVRSLLGWSERQSAKLNSSETKKLSLSYRSQKRIGRLIAQARDRRYSLLIPPTKRFRVHWRGVPSRVHRQCIKIYQVHK